MKKGIILALILCLCVSLLAGCAGSADLSGDPSSDPSTTPSSQPDTTPHTQPAEAPTQPTESPYRPEGVIYEDLAVPEAYLENCEQAGSTKTLLYDVVSEYDPSITEKKTACVYLPYGYDESKQYNILYLLHGAGGTYTEWITAGKCKQILDNMIYNGEIEPLIVVTPTFYYSDGFCGESDGKQDSDFNQFAKELRYSLIPAVEGKYSTYASGDVSEASLTATRDHRAFAGLSMGSKHTFECCVMTNLDLFAWLGSFSGVFTPEAVDISAALHSEAYGQYPIRYLFVANGTGDYSYEGHIKTMLELEQIDDTLTDGENFSINVFLDAEHDFENWKMALYRFLPLIFTDTN